MNHTDTVVPGDVLHADATRCAGTQMMQVQAAQSSTELKPGNQQSTKWTWLRRYQW